MNLQENIRKILREELNKPSESEFKQALKDVMSLIPLISHRILHDENMEHNEEKIIELNKEILQKVIKGDDEILDEMWNRAGSMVIKHAINVITYYTKMNLEEGLITEKCWKGYTQKGMKTMFGKRYPNCVKKRK
jgi:sRNA-binding regulator protein Hfq